MPVDDGGPDIIDDTPPPPPPPPPPPSASCDLLPPQTINRPTIGLEMTAAAQRVDTVRRRAGAGAGAAHGDPPAQIQTGRPPGRRLIDGDRDDTPTRTFCLLGGLIRSVLHNMSSVYSFRNHVLIVIHIVSQASTE